MGFNSFVFPVEGEPGFCKINKTNLESLFLFYFNSLILLVCYGKLLLVQVVTSLFISTFAKENKIRSIWYGFQQIIKYHDFIHVYKNASFDTCNVEHSRSMQVCLKYKKKPKLI